MVLSLKKKLTQKIGHRDFETSFIHNLSKFQCRLTLKILSNGPHIIKNEQVFLKPSCPQDNQDPRLENNQADSKSEKQ